MAYQRHEFEDEWQGFEPKQPPGRSRWLLWLVIIVTLLCLVTVCLISGYFLVQQFTERTEIAPPPLLVPTSPFAPTLTAEATTIAGTSITVTAEIAPTATLNQAPGGTIAPSAGANVEASQVAIPPTIDGELSEWPSTTVYQSTFRVYNAGNWDGTNDLTANWRLTWDNNNLYIGVEVTDDIHVQTQSGNQIFRGDSVDMQFDTNRNGDYGPGLSPDDYQITFSPGDFAGLPPSAFRFQGTVDGGILDAPGGHNVNVAAQRTAAGYNLEAAIPWSDLSLTPSSGLVIGLALNANDNDTPGTAVQEIMMSNASARTLTNPTTWGTLTLR